jgi:phosphoketolase
MTAAVPPILHLNGYKIANPTVLGRMSDEEISSLFVGCGYEPLFVEGAEPMAIHRLMADKLATALESIRSIQKTARDEIAPAVNHAMPCGELNATRISLKATWSSAMACASGSPAGK